MWDTQHAVLFCQSLCMSAFELRLPLPCGQALWEASTPAEWARLSVSTAPEPMYLLALKAYIARDGDARRVPHRLNGLSRVIVFHGLMSIGTYEKMSWSHFYLINPEFPRTPYSMFT